MASIRWKDVAVLQGPPLMGLAIAWPGAGADSLWRAPVTAAAAWLLVAHVFCLNDWAGIEADRLDANKAAGTFLARGVSGRAMARLAAALGVAGLALFAFLPVPTFLVAAAFAVLSLLYSHPAVSAKGVPVLSSLVHVAAGALLFLVGYCPYAAIDRRGLLLGAYFGIVFAAGHLTQEAGDHEADSRSGIRTNAVRFGKRRTFIAGFVLFSVSFLLMVVLGLTGVVPRAMAGIAAFYPVQVVYFRRALGGGLGYDAITRYRGRYRVIFLLIGATMCLALLLARLGR